MGMFGFSLASKRSMIAVQANGHSIDYLHVINFVGCISNRVGH
jgi:hypothetical protein